MPYPFPLQSVEVVLQRCHLFLRVGVWGVVGRVCVVVALRCPDSFGDHPNFRTFALVGFTVNPLGEVLRKPDGEAVVNMHPLSVRT